MRRIVGRTYRSKRNGILGRWRMTGLELDRCLFDNCHVSCSWLLKRRFLIQNVTFLNCSHIGTGMDAAVLEDVIVDGWRNEGRIPLFAWACVFKHVSLRGRITAVKLTDGPTPWSSRRPEDWTAANRAYYAQVDWALDIRQARFGSAPELHFIPGSLIRRDEESQVLVTRDQAIQALGAGLPWGDSAAVELALQWFVDDGPYEDVVLAAPRAAKYFRSDLAALEMLRREGLGT